MFAKRLIGSAPCRRQLQFPVPAQVPRAGDSAMPLQMPQHRHVSAVPSDVADEAPLLIDTSIDCVALHDAEYRLEAFSAVSVFDSSSSVFGLRRFVYIRCTCRIAVISQPAIVKSLS